MRLLSFTAITEVVQGFSLSPILEASVDSGLSWGLLGWRGGKCLPWASYTMASALPPRRISGLGGDSHAGVGRTFCVLLN